MVALGDPWSVFFVAWGSRGWGRGTKLVLNFDVLILVILKISDCFFSIWSMVHNTVTVNMLKSVIRKS